MILYGENCRGSGTQIARAHCVSILLVERSWLEFSARLSDEARGQIGAKTVAIFRFGMETSGAGLEASSEKTSRVPGSARSRWASWNESLERLLE